MDITARLKKENEIRAVAVLADDSGIARIKWAIGSSPLLHDIHPLTNAVLGAPSALVAHTRTHSRRPSASCRFFVSGSHDVQWDRQARCAMVGCGKFLFDGTCIGLEGD